MSGAARATGRSFRGLRALATLKCVQGWTSAVAPLRARLIVPRKCPAADAERSLVATTAFPMAPSSIINVVSLLPGTSNSSPKSSVQRLSNAQQALLVGAHRAAVAGRVHAENRGPRRV